MERRVIEHDHREARRVAPFGERLEVGRHLSLIARTIEFTNFQLLALSKK
jgi:hypothetical protein